MVLNSACGDYNNPPAWVTPSCTLTGAMLNWLRADLDADRARCELVVFHEPAFATPAPWGGKKAMRTPWWTMELRGVDLVVTGHNHAYERFAQQDHTGRRSTLRDPVGGRRDRRQPPHCLPRHRRAHSLVRDDGHHGMLRLKLRPDGWTQEFRGVTGVSRDAVAAGCRPQALAACLYEGAILRTGARVKLRDAWAGRQVSVGWGYAGMMPSGKSGMISSCSPVAATPPPP